MALQNRHYPCPSSLVTGFNRWPLCHPVTRFGVAGTHRVQGARPSTLTSYANVPQSARRERLSVCELKARAKRVQEREKQWKRDQLLANSRKDASPASIHSSDGSKKKFGDCERRNGSLAKPLSSILNIDRILSSPHTSEQISALWTAYHTTKTEGSHICATIPMDMYARMIETARKYPSFVVPLARGESTVGSKEKAYEFYFLQWAFHVPPSPRTSGDPISGPAQETSTIFFTPLQEYKMRASFATPYLVITNYTDFAHSHGIVLLRGSVTPGLSGGSLLKQTDARTLTLAVQRFYLWDASGDEQLEAQGRLMIYPGTPSILQPEPYALMRKPGKEH